MNTLQSRVDQRNTLVEGLRHAASTAEEQTLPGLRDGLILASAIPVHPGFEPDLDVFAKSLGDRLAIDTQMDGCQKTTRVAQAIETLQVLVWSVRTGQYDNPRLDLDADTADDFDEEWEWIGSYANWRAAMFVFLYPENILLPSLRKQQTPGFRELVAKLRSNRRLTPESARRQADAYSKYFRDVTSLTIEASCDAMSRDPRASSRDASMAPATELVFLFARGGFTNTVYWSAYDPASEDDLAQTFWTQVRGLDSIDVTKIVGAVPYRNSSDLGFVSLFFHTQENAEEKLFVTKLDLESLQWDEEATELGELPEKAKTFSAVVSVPHSIGQLPELVVQAPSGAVYRGSLNAAFSDVDSWRQILEGGRIERSWRCKRSTRGTRSWSHAHRDVVTFSIVSSARRQIVAGAGLAMATGSGWLVGSTTARLSTPSGIPAAERQIERYPAATLVKVR